MPQRRIALSVLAAFGVGLAPQPAAAGVEIEGVRFERAHEVGGVPLRLQGVGLLRWRRVLKAYVAALYVGEPGAGEVLGAAPRRLEIEYFWPLRAEDFARATREGIERNLGPGRAAPLRERIERLGRAYRDVASGDRYALTYLPGVGTELALDGERLCLVEGSDFAAAVFSIWLGPAPLDAELKARLLGAAS